MGINAIKFILEKCERMIREADYEYDCENELKSWWDEYTKKPSVYEQWKERASKIRKYQR
jgi:hypothetical protein